MEQQFYVCRRCGAIVTPVVEDGGSLACCGQAMTRLVPNSLGEPEVHIPIWNVCGNTVHVTVSRVLHPMTPQHHIGWIFLKTSRGSQLRRLCPGQPPKAVFTLSPVDRVESVYAWCNLHGLWKG